MARTSLTVTLAAAALCLAFADPTPATTTSGPQTLNIDYMTGKWWSYLREGNDGPYHSVEMDIIRKTPEEIAVYKQSWILRNNSQNETNQAHSSDLINWQNVFFYSESNYGKLKFTFLIEVLADPLHIRIINLEGTIILFRIKFKDGKLSFREVNGVGGEYNIYRTLPDLTTYRRCENFDIFDASEAFDDSSLVGTWTTNTQIRGSFFTLRVTRKTPDETSAFRDNLRNTTIEEADINWTKVRLEAELFSTGSDFRVHGLIEDLEKPGSIRVIPLKDAWDSFSTMEVNTWFESQNLIIKKDDGFLAVRNCDNPWQSAYFSRRPSVRSRKMPWKRTSRGLIHSEKSLL